MDKAAQLSEGTKIFQSSNDVRIYSEHGEDVPRKDSITEHHPDSPKWEEYQQAKKATKDIEKRRHDVELYQREVIDPAKKRLGNTDEPMTTEELDKLVKKINTEMPVDVRLQHNTYELTKLRLNDPVRNKTADELFGSYESNAPKIQADFKTAHDEPYGSSATSLPTIIHKLHKTNRHLLVSIYILSLNTCSGE